MNKIKEDKKKYIQEKPKTFKNIINNKKKNIYISLIVVKENPRTPIIRICAQNHPV